MALINARRSAALAAWLVAASCVPTAQAAVPSLWFGAEAQVYGSLGTSYTSVLLGDVYFTVNGPSSYTWFNGGAGQTGTGLASVTYTLPAQQVTSDPLYNLVTDFGQYGFSYAGQAEVNFLRLRTLANSTAVDASGQAVDSTPSTSLWAQAYGNWSQQLYIAPTASRPAGSYGALVVGITLDGQFPQLSGVNNNASAQLQASTSFTDTAGVSYTSSFAINGSTGNWSGQQTTFKKLLFQYGTPFTLNLSQWSGVGTTGSADFFNTGQISSVELPYGATLESGAEQAGLGSAASLMGHVFNSATPDAQNTNWDFGNNGGGFTPNVPEPQSWALMAAGAVLLAWRLRRRQDKAQHC